MVRTVELLVTMDVSENSTDEQIEGAVTRAIYAQMTDAGDVDVHLISDDEEN